MLWKKVAAKTDCGYNDLSAFNNLVLRKMSIGTIGTGTKSSIFPHLRYAFRQMCGFFTETCSLVRLYIAIIQIGRRTKMELQSLLIWSSLKKNCVDCREQDKRAWIKLSMCGRIKYFLATDWTCLPAIGGICLRIKEKRMKSMNIVQTSGAQLRPNDGVSELEKMNFQLKKCFMTNIQFWRTRLWIFDTGF